MAIIDMTPEGYNRRSRWQTRYLNINPEGLWPRVLQ